MAGRPKNAIDDHYYRQIGNSLRLARLAAGKTQAEAAEHIDSSFQQLQKYEKGVNRIPVKELDRLCAYYEVPLPDLLHPSGSGRKIEQLAGKFTARGLHALLESWSLIKDQPMRTALLQLVKAAAEMSR